MSQPRYLPRPKTDPSVEDRRGPSTGPSPPDTAQRRAVVACALAVAASGCTLVDAEVRQGRYSLLFVASAVFAFLVFFTLTWWAWHRAFRAWKHPAELRTSTRWIPYVLLAATTVWFALDILIVPVEGMQPGEEWIIVVIWLVGAIVGSGAGWIAGKMWGRWRFRRLHPGK